MKKEEVNQISPLVWAYIGDSIYEVYIREHLIKTTKFKPNKLHIETIKYVKAKSQAEILKLLKKCLSEEELDIIRRARNTENHHLPKNADPQDYMYSTAFEGLIGYLYLTGQKDRLNEILGKCIK